MIYCTKGNMHCRKKKKKFEQILLLIFKIFGGGFYFIPPTRLSRSHETAWFCLESFKPETLLKGWKAENCTSCTRVHAYLQTKFNTFSRLPTENSRLQNA